MTWPWYHNAGQTMTHLKISQKTWQAAAAQPVRPSLAVHVVCSSSLISYLNLPSFPPFVARAQNANTPSIFIAYFSYSDIEKTDQAVSEAWILPLFFLCIPLFISMPLPLSVLFLSMSGLSALQQPAERRGPARESLSYWFNDASSYFTGIYMSVALNTLSTRTNTA